ncbi:MAG: NTP transferase domain-containing protein, partial [Gammaproteobacteria bacterium]|nr:NTP transferase domain-containing protein [Gammaproteobacteria bacterium]
GKGNKLLLEVEGVPLVRRVVDAALASACSGVVVVTGHEATKVAAVLPRGRLKTVACSD